MLMILRRMTLMAKKKIDFYRLGNELWSTANIFRDDTLKTTEYLEEFSYFLFLKLFDDQEKQKEEMAKLDKKKYIPYLPEELRFYNWAEKIIDGEVPINEVVSTVKKIFQDLAVIKDHDSKDLSLFRRLFRNHIWRIKYGPTIRDLLKRLVDLELEQNFDVMGRAYEFVVQKLGEQKQYGQYFTPRHIIHFMVELADPDIGEKIYDPAAGTGGFILKAFEKVSKKIEEKYKNDYSIVERYFRELKEKNLWAIEKAPDVYKLALMNMILHNDGKSNLYEADSLDNRAQLEHKQKYDVVLTNPPYGPLTQSRVGIFDYHVKRFEALFIQHVMNALKFSKNGKKPSRAVVIILDKILFDSTRAFKNIRKKLLREYNLKAVFSMPAGIFQPYSGVKTTILYFERPAKEEWNEIKANNSYTTKQILFFDIKSDGFTLSTQRRPINGVFQGDEPNIYEPPCGDLPNAVEVFREWLRAIDSEKIEEFKEKYADNEQVCIADIKEIQEKDFNLNPGLYRRVESGKVKWEWVKLTDVAKISRESVKPFDGQRYYLTTGNLKEDEIEKLDIVTYTQRPSRANLEVQKYDVIFAKMEDTKKYLLINDKNKDLIVSTGFAVLRPFSDKILPKFLFYIVKSNFFQNQKDAYATGATQKAIGTRDISKITIPLPPIEIQQKIVERLDKQRAIIEKAKEIEKAILDAGIDNIIFEGDWEQIEFGKLIESTKYGLSKQLNGSKEDIPILRINNISNKGKLVFDDLKYIKLSDHEIGNYSLKENDLLIVRSNGNPELVGRTAIVDYLPKKPFVYASYLIRIRLKKSEILPKFANYLFISNKVRKEILKRKRQSGGTNNINVKEIKSIKIPLPPLEKQKEIVEFLDVEFESLEKIRRMRENAEKMSKLILEKELSGDEKG